MTDIRTRNVPSKFLVAFSFAGEQRDLVRAVAEVVEQEIGSSNVFFDEWFEHYIAGADADRKGISRCSTCSPVRCSRRSFDRAKPNSTSARLVAPGPAACRTATCIVSGCNCTVPRTTDGTLGRPHIPQKLGSEGDPSRYS